MNACPHRQRGAALITALVFLVLITLLSVSSMQSSTLELKMAGNEQARTEAVQSAQSAADAVMDAGGFTAGSVGDKTCFNPPGTVTDCDTSLTLSGTGYDGDNYVAVETTDIGSCPRVVSSSSRSRNSLRTAASPSKTGKCAYFEIDSLRDALDAGGGRANVVQGFARIIY